MVGSARLTTVEIPLLHTLCGQDSDILDASASISRVASQVQTRHKWSRHQRSRWNKALHMHNTGVLTSAHDLSLMPDFWKKILKKSEKLCTNPIRPYWVHLDHYFFFFTRTLKYSSPLLDIWDSCNYAHSDSKELFRFGVPLLNFIYFITQNQIYMRWYR